MENGLKIASAAVTDRGLSEKRPQNEDAYLEMPQCGIFAVADGVGGAQAGEVASQMAMELLSEAFANLPPGADAEAAMNAAFAQANSAIHQMSHELPQLSSMATTVVALHLNGEIATIGHVGDSRLYRLDADGELYRETDDHSMVGEEVRAGRMTEEQAENHPSRNIISRALGAEPTVEAELKTIMIQPGTAFLLCSDGITRHVSDAEIKGVLTFGGPPADICEYVKNLCYERGAEDNLTAVVVKIASAAADTVADTDPQEDATVATARVSAFGADNDNDLLLELDTQELPPTPVSERSFETTAETSESSALLELGDDETEPAAPQAHRDSVEEPPFEPGDRVPFGTAAGYIGDEETRGSGSMILPIAMLMIGAAIGLGVYHFALRPTPEAPAVPPLTEMSSPNIPMSAFEKNRRNVDSDPAGYIAKSPTEPQDCEDFYLLGRAYLLTGQHQKAREAFLAARAALTSTDPTVQPDRENYATLATEIAQGLAVTNNTTYWTIFDNELRATPRTSVNPSPSP